MFYLKMACPTNIEDAISPAYLPELERKHSGFEINKL